MILLTKTGDKKTTASKSAPPTLVVYDLKQHKVTRTIPWPNSEEREFINIMFSPDGKLLYFFADDVLIYDTNDFKQVDKWELSRPARGGAGPVRLRLPRRRHVRRARLLHAASSP